MNRKRPSKIRSDKLTAFGGNLYRIWLGREMARPNAHLTMQHPDGSIHEFRSQLTLDGAGLHGQRYINLEAIDRDDLPEGQRHVH